MISLLRKLQYTDSVPVCPWVTSRPPRNLPQTPQATAQSPAPARPPWGQARGSPAAQGCGSHCIPCLSHPNAHPLKSCSLTFWPRNSRNSTKAGLSSLVLKSSSSEVWGHTEGVGHGTGAPELLVLPPAPHPLEKAGRRTPGSP